MTHGRRYGAVVVVVVVGGAVVVVVGAAVVVVGAAVVVVGAWVVVVGARVVLVDVDVVLLDVVDDVDEVVVVGESSSPPLANTATAMAMRNTSTRTMATMTEVF